MNATIPPWEAQILALVSGFPPEVPATRRLLMLQAYIDESYTDGELFVMAGYIAPLENWLALSADWHVMLQLGPPHWLRIDELHMNQMTSPLGLEQCELFYRVIEKHLDVGFSCSIRLADLRSAFDSF